LSKEDMHMTKNAKKPSPKKATKTATATPTPGPRYKPTAIALGVGENGKPKVLVGARRIAAFKGEIVDRAARYWSQLKYVKVGKGKDGRLHLTSARDAAAKGLEVLS
jgi:hypothetical protein